MSEDVLKIIRDGESETRALMGAKSDAKTILQAVCGMLNQQGGIIIWGVGDRGTIQGVAAAARKAEDLTRHLLSSIFPRPLLSATAEPVQGKQVVVIDIPAGSDKPYSCDRQIWVRLGKRILRAGIEDSARIVEARSIQQTRWEREPVPGLSLPDLDERELAETIKNIRAVNRIQLDQHIGTEELPRLLNVWRHGQITNAGLVVFARMPRQWAPNVHARIIVHVGAKGGAVSDDIIVDGPAVRVVYELIDLIQQKTGHSSAYNKQQLERIDRPAYALYALREGIVNAITHRSYESAGRSVTVEIHKDRLVISNPGFLPDGWTVQTLRRQHISAPVNPDIAQVFFLRGLMEQLGVGTQRVIDECKKIKAKARWRVEHGMVYLTLFKAPDPQVDDALSTRQARFIKTLKLGAEFQVEDYAKDMDVSERQSRRDLSLLCDLGFVERVGKGRATRYRKAWDSST